MPANLAWTAVSRNDKPQPTCSKSVCSNASIEENPRNRFTEPLLRPACSQPTGSSSRRTGQSSSSDMRRRLHPNKAIINAYLSAYGGGAVWFWPLDLCPLLRIIVRPETVIPCNPLGWSGQGWAGAICESGVWLGVIRERHRSLPLGCLSVSIQSDMCNSTLGQFRMQCYRVLLPVRALSLRLIADSKAA